MCGAIGISACDRTPVASTTEKGFALYNESNQLPCEYERDLDAWTCAWYDAAIARDFVRSPYHPDAATLKRLQDYFHAGLLPAEAAEACFGRKH
jgi:hypothetical protein